MRTGLPVAKQPAELKEAASETESAGSPAKKPSAAEELPKSFEKEAAI